MGRLVIRLDPEGLLEILGRGIEFPLFHEQDTAVDQGAS